MICGVSMTWFILTLDSPAPWLLFLAISSSASVPGGCACSAVGVQILMSCSMPALRSQQGSLHHTDRHDLLQILGTHEPCEVPHDICYLMLQNKDVRMDNNNAAAGAHYCTCCTCVKEQLSTK